MKIIEVMKYILIIMLSMITVSCDEEDDYKCPENIMLPPYSNTGEDIVGCKIDGEVWIGDHAELCHGFYGCTSSFDITQQVIEDEDGYVVRDEMGT